MKKNNIALIVVLILTLIILVNNAWIGDDAYITFRTIDNFINGHGLTWNINERVQVYTHPLWMFYITFFYFFTREIYFTAIIISILTSFAGILLLTFKLAINRTTAFLSILLLISCKNFIDYTTSGLENPLTYLLLIIFFIIYFKKEINDSTILLLCFISSLAMINRLDTILLFLPVLIYLFFKFPLKKSIKTFFIGYSLFFCWELFSLIYYGFPIPNTAFAKLSTGIDKYDLISQGFQYFIATYLWSPITFLVILCSIVYYLFRPSLKYLLPAIGIILYLLYVLKIGGCYMTGRFFAAPFLLSVILLSQIPFKWKSFPSISIILIVIVSIFYPKGSPISSGSDVGESLEAKRWHYGISDERSAWYKTTGLLVQHTDSIIPNHQWAKEGLQLKEQNETYSYRAGIGLSGFFAGPDIYIIDGHSLPNLLTARLPIADLKNWRIGHFYRILPEGYIESIEQKKNLIKDNNLSEYFQKLTQITTGPILSLDRFKMIALMNLGNYDYLLEAYINRPTKIPYTKINSSKTTGTNYNCPTCLVINKNGLIIDFDTIVHPSEIEISVDHNDNYLLNFLLNKNDIGDIRININWIPERGLRVDSLSVPAKVIATGFNKILITPIDGDDKYSVGHLKIIK